MSLREQLLKAGLVSEGKSRQVDAEIRKQAHLVKKNKTIVASEMARKIEEQRQLNAESERKREHDRQLNRERETHKKRKEETARARQLIESNRLNEAEADVRYNFLVNGVYVRSVRVTLQQQKLLAMGRIGIVRNDDEYDFSLVPRAIALKLAELSADRLLLLHPKSDNAEEEEWD